MSTQFKNAPPAAKPDEIDRDEWEHFQRDTIKLDEVQQVPGSLPARVGNDIARTARVIITQTQKEEPASQLVESLSDARKATKTNGDVRQHARESAPIPNGFSGSPTQVLSRRKEKRVAKARRAKGNRSAPIPNRKSGNGRRPEANTQMGTTAQPGVGIRRRGEGVGSGVGPGLPG